MLRKISICQSASCDHQGSEIIFNRLENLYAEKFREQYPNLIIEKVDCLGDCAQGPIIKINDAIVLRNFEKEKVPLLFENPEAVLGKIMHVQDEDREAFERIIGGDL